MPGEGTRAAQPEFPGVHRIRRAAHLSLFLNLKKRSADALESLLTPFCPIFQGLFSEAGRRDRSFMEAADPAPRARGTPGHPRAATWRVGVRSAARTLVSASGSPW